MANRGVNKVILIGTVGGEPELKALQQGSVASFSMVTNESYKDKKTGQKIENAEWHNIKFFGGVTSVIENYVHKGTQLYVEGKLTTSKWEDKTTGQMKYKTEILGSQLQLLGGGQNQAASEEDVPW